LIVGDFFGMNCRFTDRVDHLIIETSGIADLQPLLETFRSHERLSLETHVDCAVALVDAASFSRLAYTTLVRLSEIFVDGARSGENG